MKKYSKLLLIMLFVITLLVSICFIPFNATKLIPIIEEQIENELGVKAHIERLILRFGPSIKIKAPIMHLTYCDGQKFAQFDNVKFFVPWTSILKDKPVINKISANRLNVRVSSNDKYLSELLYKLQTRNYKEIPNLKLKEYKISYNDTNLRENYLLNGQLLEVIKLKNYKNFKLITVGSFNINDKKYLTYDLTITPNINLPEINNNVELNNVINQVKELDFYSDIIADVKLYQNQNSLIQASGFINIDNISVLDIERKDPKSFVYLTLWGDKASILSNIYTSNNKKAYIEGMINNSKKPTVDIKVKTDEIELSNLYDKLKLVFNYSFLKDIKSLKGTMNANFTLKGDLNKLKSNGFLKINNANLIADGVEIKNINSDIDFSNNIVNIVKAIGYVNNAPIIAKGKIDKNIDIELLMNKVELKYLCPKSLGIKSGVASLIANIYGTFDNITHKENLQIENFLVENDDINLLVDSIKMDTNKSNQIQISNVICKSAFADVIKAPMIRLFIEENGLKLPNTNIYLPNSKLIVKGSILDILKNFNFSLNANGFINSRDITYFKNYSNPYPVNISISGNKDVQNILSQILIEKTDIFDEPTVINLVSRLDKNTLKLEDLSLVNFTGKFSEDFKLNLKGQKKVIISGLIENLDELLIKNLRIFIPQQLNIKFQDTLAQLKGDVFVNGNFDKPEIVGQIAVNNLYNQTLQLAISNATLDFNKNNFIFNSPILKIADSTMGVNALVSTDLTNAITVKNLNVKSKYLNTDTILMYKDSPILNLYPIQINSGKFYSEKILANIYGSSLYLSGFNSDIELNDNIISLKNISSELFNGKLAGTLKYNLLDEHFDSNIQARGVSASPIFNIISTKKESISGTMDFDTNLIGELTSKQSLNGDIKFLVSNGRMSTLGKLEHLLYAQNILADNMLRTSLSVVTKAITLKDTGLFKYLRGEVELNNGIAKINLLQSQGPLMSLFIKGTYNPINDYAQLTVLGRLSDEVISGLGAFGEFSFKKLLIMLTGENNSYNIKLDDIEKLPQLPMKNTKEFRAIINGIIDKPSSVALFNWISYTEKSLKQKDVPMDNTPVPDFVEKLPY